VGGWEEDLGVRKQKRHYGRSLGRGGHGGLGHQKIGGCRANLDLGGEWGGGGGIAGAEFGLKKRKPRKGGPKKVEGGQGSPKSGGFGVEKNKKKKKKKGAFDREKVGRE